MNKRILEIAVFNYKSAVLAEVGGADRIELSENYKVGGVTPSFKLIEKVKRKIKIPIFVLIRPRSGNFIYSDSEFKIMKEEILFCKKINIEGVVFGILKNKNKVDVERNSELVNIAKPLSTTFHKAFDDCPNKFDSLNNVIECGFDRVLTSGNTKSGEDGLIILKKLFNYSKSKIILIPGGGVRSSNIEHIINFCDPQEIHSSAITNKKDIANIKEIIKMKSFLK
ncbi:MAG: copper homeostasis protein CutC [Bacteroidetes bacterium]|nr:copper homeostasis protein CutC [Bacteroidota bacterium]